MKAARADVSMATTRNPKGFRFSPESERVGTWIRRFQMGYDDAASLYLTPRSAIRAIDEMTADGLIIETEQPAIPEPPIPKA